MEAAAFRDAHCVPEVLAVALQSSADGLRLDELRHHRAVGHARRDGALFGDADGCPLSADAKVAQVPVRKPVLATPTTRVTQRPRVPSSQPRVRLAWIARQRCRGHTLGSLRQVGGPACAHACGSGKRQREARADWSHPLQHVQHAPGLKHGLTVVQRTFLPRLAVRREAMSTVPDDETTLQQPQEGRVCEPHGGKCMRWRRDGRCEASRRRSSTRRCGNLFPPSRSSATPECCCR